MQAFSSEQPIIETNELFKPSDWLETIKRIKNTLHNDNCLVTVLAEQGEGKSSFVQLFYNESHLTENTCRLDALQLLNSADVAQFLRKAWLTSMEEHIPLFKLVEIINQQKEYRLLIIDNADQLSVPLLYELLAEIKRYKHLNYFQLCLVANPSIQELYAQFDLEEFKDDIVLFSLGVLTEQETYAFITSQLSDFHQSKMTQSQLREFYHLTQGNIRLIHYNLPELVQQLSLVQPKKNGFEQFVLGSCGLLTLAASIYIWQNLPILSSFYESVQLTELIAHTDPVISTESKNLASLVVPYTQAVTRSVIQPPPLNQVVEIAEDEEEVLEKMAIIDSVVSVPKTLHHTQVLSQAMYRQRAGANDTLEEVPIDPDLIALVNELSPKLKSTIVNFKQLANKEIIHQTPKVQKNHPFSGFTVQFLASKQQSDIIQFIKQNLAHLPVKIWQTKREGQSWYVVTVGQYSQKQEAIAAAKKLTSRLAGVSPWVRSTDGLKAWG